MNFEFVIDAWAALAPGLDSETQWKAWARHPGLPSAGSLPELSEVPAMVRRRLNPLGRMAVQAAWRAHGDAAGMPVVMASRYGDAGRSLELLGGLARNEPASPTAFGLSVHNAISAVYSIARADTANYISVAGGRASAAAGLIEAAGLLADGADQALLVCYDAPLPGAYAAFADEPPASYAWAWRIARALRGQPHFSLSDEGASSASGSQTLPPLPFGLDALRFVLSSDPALERQADGHWWRWQRHG